MNHVIRLLAELFLIGCVHMIITMFVDFEKMPFLGKIFTFACYAGGLFVLARFITLNLIPQLSTIFRNIF